jgi:hypothetical protein
MNDILYLLFQFLLSILFSRLTIQKEVKCENYFIYFQIICTFAYYDLSIFYVKHRKVMKWKHKFRNLS